MRHDLARYDVIGQLFGHVVRQGIGESDCELIGEGVFAQPVNAWTSFAYAVLGVWIALRYGRSGDVIGWMSVGFAAILLLVGAGSVMFHGPQGVGAQWLHDVPIVLAIAFIAFWNLASINRITWIRAAQYIVLTAILVGLAAVAVPSIALLAGIPVAVAAVASEWMVRRRPVLWASVVGVVAVGGILNLLGRTSGPLCDPTSLVQLHGAWHVFTALAFLLWARGASETSRLHDSTGQPAVAA